MPKKNRFINLETTQIPLADSDDWIEVKNQLSYGDQLKLGSAGIQTVSAGALDGAGEDSQVGIDWGAMQMARILIWVVDWSFTNEKGKVVPVSRDAIRNLDPATSNEINDLLDDHIADKTGSQKATVPNDGPPTASSESSGKTA